MGVNLGFVGDVDNVKTNNEFEVEKPRLTRPTTESEPNIEVRQNIQFSEYVF